MMDLLDRLSREAPPPTARIAYGAAPQQFGDLRLPAVRTEEPYPVVIVLHGGYWRARFDLGYFGAACGALARAGVATWNVEYRRIADAGGGWPGTFADIAAAADALRALTMRYPLDLGRVLALGLAARARLPADSPLASADPLPLRGVVALAGVADLRRAWELRLSENITETLMGGAPADVPERYAAGSPYERLPLGLPQTLFHGTRDANVPFAISEAYVARAQSLGDAARLEPLEGVGHFEPVDPATPAWDAVARATLALVRG